MLRLTFNALAIAAIAIASIGCTKNEISGAETAKGLATKTFAATNVTAAVAGNTYYVAASGGNDTYDGKAAAFDGTHGPYLTINKAVSKTSPGDVVKILPGQYTFQGSGDAVVTIDHPGASGSPVTYEANDVNHKPVIHVKATDNIDNAIAVLTNFIVIKNLEISGEVASCYTSTPQGAAKYNTNGIEFGGFTTSTTALNDLEVDNCIVHDFPGAGIATKKADKITIHGNTIYNNAFYSQYGTSGISILTPTNTGYASNGTKNGDSTHPKIIVEENLCYNNKETVTDVAQGKTTDGNGIIIDVNYTNNPYGDYDGYTVVQNNICYTNGGAGIQITRAQNVSVINNTTCNNGQVLGYAELNLDNYCQNLIITNNILYGDKTNAPYNAYTPNSTIKFNYNIYYPYGTATKGANDITTNPLFAGNGTQNIPTDFGNYAPPTFFKLMSTSPAINSGTNQGSAYYAYYDFDNYYRAMHDTKPDRGAYEFH